MTEEVTVLRTGLTIESTGAVVLMFKAGSVPTTSIVLCLWTKSPHDPFVVWTYSEVNGACVTGDYFNNLPDAVARFNNRTW